MIRLENVYKGFYKKKLETIVLENINFNAIQGDFIVILGPSGSGKSTLLEIMAGLSRPTSGKTLYDGVELIEPCKDISLVFQDYALFPWLTVLENLEFALKVQKIPKLKWEKLCNHYLDLIHLSDSRHKYPSELSGGMKQRVALVRALIGDPKVLLFDEPFAALDAFTREELQKETLNIIKKYKKTAVFVTHSIEEALLLADRILILSANPGKIIKDIRIPRLIHRDIRSSEMTKIFQEIKTALIQTDKYPKS